MWLTVAQEARLSLIGRVAEDDSCLWMPNLEMGGAR